MGIRTLKRKLDRVFSNYIRLRDALELHKETGTDISLGRCCTCGKIGQWRYMDCGHFISKGMGGASGVRYDERNAHLQCNSENAFEQGNIPAYREFMLNKYGQEIIDELKIKDKTHTYSLLELEGLLLYYKQEYKKLNDNLK